MQASKTEFIVLMAALIAMVALSIDAMLPALSFIADDLLLTNDNDRQLVVTTIFAGMALGQFVYGPVSDSVGRKPVVIFGLLLFLLGSIVCIFANSFWLLLLGRFLQGLGAAASRNIATAIIRDGFKGDEMARIVSIIMAVFVAIPMFAPALGQLILLFTSWRSIFIALFVLALVLLLWFYIRQPETLAISERRVFSLSSIYYAFKEVFFTRVAIAYTLINGLVFGAFVSFLGSSQQLIQEDYSAGKLYALYFALLASAFCLAAIINSRLVVKMGAANMTKAALIILITITVLFITPVWLADGKPVLLYLMIYLFLACFATGLLMGNVSALALEPLGHIAGTASAVVGGFSTLIAITVASVVGLSYAGNVYPFVIAFFASGLCGLYITQFACGVTK